MNQETLSITLEQISAALGFPVHALLPLTLERFSTANLEYQVIEGQERDALLKSIIQSIYTNPLSVVGKQRHGVWENGWSENLEAFVASGYDPDALLPRYVHTTRPLRWQQQYIRAIEPNLEFRFVRILRAQVFGHFFASVDHVFEFGCGTGLNLLELASFFPTKSIVGLDWTLSSQNIIGLIHQHISANIRGGSFNFFEPDAALTLPQNSGVLTMGALEQVGSEFGPFLAFLLRQKPRMVLHVEPLVEVYDEAVLSDYLAAEYHRKRNYLNGYVSALQKLEQEGSIRILTLQRTGLGSLFNEGYSYIAWEPL